jgi:uncharacterized protein (TIGR02599 family)
MKPRTRRNAAAFTLVEVLVAAALLVTILGFLLSLTDQTTRIWTGTTAKVEQFRDARTAFERMTSRISQATLNTYWDYDSATAPKRYERRSELRFISGSAATLVGNSPLAKRVTHCIFFNAPIGVASNANDRGLANALNSVGYFAELGDDSAQRPDFITNDMIAPRWRFRLVEFAQPTENFSLYQFTSGAASTYTGLDWFTVDANSITPTGLAMRHVIAENVIALIITPRLAKAEEKPLQANATHSPLATNYRYDSMGTNTNKDLNPRNQLPPVVQLMLIAIDEKSSDRLNLDSSKVDIFAISNLFQNTMNFDTELATLETKLTQMKMRYRIFSTNVHIRAAKWSREQTNP